MNLARELVQYDGYELNDLRQTLQQEGFDLAFGSTYSIKEIHKAITDNQPAFVRIGNGIKNKTVYIVGENENSLVAFRDGELFELADSSLQKAWTGEAIIILDKKRQVTESFVNKQTRLEKAVVQDIDIQGQPTEDDEPPDFVIFPSERDNWDVENEEIKQRGKRQIARVKYLGVCELPIHPVIVTFRKPDGEDVKKGHRAANNGVEIEIYDPSDPLTEFLHELGHVYWNTRLTDEDKKRFNDLQSKLTKDNLPAIFIANWDWKDGEEIFSTIYYWHCKGKLAHDGYTRILDQQYPEGHVALMDIIKREHEKIENGIALKARQTDIENTWKENEKSISIWLNNLQGKPSLTLVKGKGVLKSKIPVPDILPYEVPEKLSTTFLGEYNDRSWCLVNEGILRNKVLVLKGNVLDVNYMKNRKNYQLVPQRRVQRHGERLFRRLVYVSPTKVLRALQEPSGSLQSMENSSISGNKALSPLKRLLKAMKDQLKVGTRIEGEHTRDPRLQKLFNQKNPDLKKIQETIGKQHLEEFDNYYTYLVEMEKIAEDDKKRPAIEKKILKWLNKNPNPNDKKVHAFAQSQGWDEHKFEQVIYKLATERAKLSKDNI